jgi:hypothetical protein
MTPSELASASNTRTPEFPKVFCNSSESESLSASAPEQSIANLTMIDTLREAKKLEEAGFAPEQAAAIVEIQWRSPSWVLHNLERSGFERKQAEAILDYYWSVRNDTLMRHPMRSGLLTGAVIALVVFGLYTVVLLAIGWHFIPPDWHMLGPTPHP